jgi:sterol desaturase/sphingolipid hydroxylase (fatty acid hydroxylase superfamily)
LALSDRGTTRPTLLSNGQYLLHYLSDARVQIYLALALSATAVTFAAFPAHPGVLWGVLAAMAFEPFAEYIIHRYIFHNQLLYRFPLTAGFWKHMHYDHHRDPNDESTIFGPADWMLAASLIITFPVGFLAGGWAGAAGAAMVGFWILVIYEYFHGAAHLMTDPPTPYGRWVKRIHVLHHFHNEKGNFGITNPLVDLLVGTYYDDPKAIDRSPTVRNLGYTEEVAQQFPWVEELDKSQGKKSQQPGG